MASLDNTKQIRDNLLQRPLQSMTNVALSGGIGQWGTRFSVEFIHEKGDFLGSRNNQWKMDWQNEYQINKYVSLNLGLNLVNDNRHSSQIGISNLSILSPYEMLLNSDGSYACHFHGSYNSDVLNMFDWSGFTYHNMNYNLLQEARSRRQRVNNTQFRLQAGLQVNIIDGLRFNSKFQFESSRYTQKRTNDEESFYTRYYEWIKQNGYQSLYLPHLARFIFVADNNTIVPGGNIYTLKSVEDNNWYQEFISSKYKAQFIFYFMGDESDAIQTKTKQVKLVRWLDYYKDTEIKKLLVINLDYPSLMSNLSSKNYGMLAYICDGEKIIFSTDGQMNIYSPYTSINDADRRKVGYTSEVSFMGKTYTVMVFPDNSNVVAGAFRKNLPVVILLLAMNILMKSADISGYLAWRM